MKVSLVHATVLTLAIGFGGSAQAVPIYFDFSGTVLGSPTIAAGSAMSGGFTLETDRLSLLLPPVVENQYDYFDLSPTGLTEPLAFIDSAGTHYEIAGLPLSFAAVNFVDACRPLCDPGVAESITVAAVTLDPYSEGYTGQLRRRDITLSNIYWNRLPDFPYYDFYDGFDGATTVPLDIVSLPAGEIFGMYNESILDCVAGECTQSFGDYLQFSVDTLTRGVGARAVPEPGTLGLFAAAMLLGIVMRRRPVRRD